MMNYKYLISRNFKLGGAFLKTLSTGSRKLLTQAYQCEKSWAKRLENPLFQNMKMDHHFIETDKKFNTNKIVSGVDIDLFANNIQDSSQLDELEHLLYRFRHTKQCTEIMDSTVYAVVRNFLKFRNYESLLRILHDRDNYGIFPDLYSYNMLMNTFLQEKKYVEAAQIAVLFMLQEDFSNEISCLLAMYSCQEFLNNETLEALYPSKDVKEAEAKSEEEDEEEETLVRVPFLRNPFFDDHFDIVEPKHLIGKTQFLTGRQMQKDILGRTYEVIGIAMYEKWSILINVLKCHIKSQVVPALMSQGVEKVQEILNESEVQSKAEIENLLEDLKKSNKIKSASYQEELKLRIENLSELEQKDINAQIELFNKWEHDRKIAYEKQNLALEKERRLKVIEEKKEYLFWKEKLLFFFENENKILVEFKKAEEIIAAQKSKSVEDTYVPPEMIKRPTRRKTKYEKLANVKSLQ